MSGWSVPPKWLRPYWTYRKSNRLKDICKRHLQYEGMRYEFGKPGPLYQTMVDVLDIAAHDPEVQDIMAQWEATPATLGRFYDCLVKSGAAVVRSGHFVAASALVIGPTLEYLLAGVEKEISWNEMALRVIQYFMDNETGIP